jgi:hypothetical protein
MSIPSSVAEIFDGALSGCEKLTRINYGGTVDMWKNLIKYDLKGACTVYCTDGEIKLWE